VRTGGSGPGKQARPGKKKKKVAPSVAWRKAPHLRFVDLQKQNKCPFLEEERE
jgi:hypothetical protein